MKLTPQKKTQARGFTLIEMIGVLAVIAILSALLIPKIFEAINNARINNACITIGTIKSALADHYAKFGSIPVDGTIPTAPVTITPAAGGTEFDQILLNEGFIDKPFAVKIGNGAATTTVQLRPGATPATVVTAANAAYDLDNEATVVNDAGGSVVCEAVITGVTETDAKDLSDRLDGVALGVALGAGPDILGRVKYAAPVAGVTTVYTYVTHR